LGVAILSAAWLLLELEGFFDVTAVIALVVVAGGRYELDVFLVLVIDIFMGFFDCGVHELSLEMNLAMDKITLSFIFG
jgi:hypothetical protein